MVAPPTMGIGRRDRGRAHGFAANYREANEGDGTGFLLLLAANIGERQRREALRHLENAREVFRALDVARSQ